jgi:GNAT superfamily N-acetyltransferase
MATFKFPSKNKVKVEQVDTNDSFNKLCENLKESGLQLDPSCEFIIENGSIIVELDRSTVIREYLAISIELDDIAAVRISSSGMNSLEITHLWVHPRHQKKGLGTKLMNLVFDLCRLRLGSVPRFTLECTGNVSHGDEFFFMDISSQAAFYRKFGFRVVDRSKYPNYLKMSKPVEVFGQFNTSTNQNLMICPQKLIYGQQFIYGLAA